MSKANIKIVIPLIKVKSFLQACYEQTSLVVLFFIPRVFAKLQTQFCSIINEEKGHFRHHLIFISFHIAKDLGREREIFERTSASKSGNSP